MMQMSEHSWPQLHQDAPYGRSDLSGLCAAKGLLSSKEIQAHLEATLHFL
jgi:hypothetical protein